MPWPGLFWHPPKAGINHQTYDCAVSSTRLTPDDLLRLEEEGLFELVDGKLPPLASSTR
jgi:hypothetical protein